MRILTGYLQQTASLVSHAPSGMLLAVFVRVQLLVRAYASRSPTSVSGAQGRLAHEQYEAQEWMDGRRRPTLYRLAKWVRVSPSGLPRHSVLTALHCSISGETWSRTVFDLHRGGL